MICADFLAGAHAEDGNSRVLLFSMLHLFRFLSPGDRQEFVAQVSAAA